MIPLHPFPPKLFKQDPIKKFLEELPNEKGDEVTIKLTGFFQLVPPGNFLDIYKIEWSGRLSRSLGLCHFSKKIIRINSKLKELDPNLLTEVLVHEICHALVFLTHGRGPAPHGKEWKALMKAGGFEPRRCYPISISAPRTKPRKIWTHNCPVCQMFRKAFRPVYRWLCARCFSLGLSGKLEVKRG